VTGYVRTLSLNSPNGTGPVVDLVSIGSFMCGIETASPAEMLFGINTGNGTTHFFVFQYSSRLVNLEINKTYFKYNGNYYALTGSPVNLNENNRVLIFGCQKRGDTTEAESK
jgi:hypothetical protein